MNVKINRTAVILILLTACMAGTALAGNNAGTSHANNAPMSELRFGNIDANVFALELCDVHWEIEADDLVLALDGPRNRISERSDNADNFSQSDHAFKFGLRSAGRVSVASALGPRLSAEIICSGPNAESVCPDDEATSVYGFHAFMSDGDQCGDAALNNVEFDLSQKLGDDGLSVFGGFQYIGADQSSKLSALSSDPMYDNVRSAFRIWNKLFGGQIGGMWQKQWGQLSLKTFVKGGFVANAARFNRANDDYQSMITDRLSTQNKPSYLFDAGVMLSYDLTKSWSVATGYEYLWMSQLARGSNLAEDRSGTAMALDDNLQMHGVSIGMEYHW